VAYREEKEILLKTRNFTGKIKPELMEGMQIKFSRI